MSMTHAFDVDHAKLYGLRESIMISNLHFWVAHNYANGMHEYDGRTWTYNSVHAFEALFPYLTYKQIRTSLETLITLDVLVRGNYNKNPADRTSWFAFTDAFLSANPLPCRANGNAPKGRANAPQGKSLIKTDVNTVVNTDGESLAALGITQSLLDDYIVVRKAKKAGDLTPTAVQGLQREAAKAGISLADAITCCCEAGWQGFRADWYAKRVQPAAMTASNRQTESFAERDARNTREAWERMTGRQWPAEELPGAKFAAPFTIDIESTEIKRLSK